MSNSIWVRVSVWLGYQQLEAYYIKINKGKDLYKGRLEIMGVAGAHDVRVAQYCIQEYISYVKYSLFSIYVPICVATIPYFPILLAT